MTTSRLPATDAPDMTETVDSRTGSVRVSGRLTEQGAELLRGTVETLHRRGHACVVVDLHDLHGTEDAGLDVLRELRESLSEEGGELLVLEGPDGARPHAAGC